MELKLSPKTSTAMALAAIFVLAILRSVLSLRTKKKQLNLPPGPRGWPMFGSLGALAGAQPPHRVLAALAACHGPLMHLKLGSHHVVVASSADTARLVLKVHDLALADRPRTAAGEITSYGYKGIVHTPYGAYWRMARKLCATELFSARRVDAFASVREQEVRALVRGVFEELGQGVGDGRHVAVREHLAGLTLRNILRMAVGEKWSGCYGSAEGEAFRGALDEAFAVTGAVSNLGEWVPWLGWLDLQGHGRRMKALHEMFDRFYEQILRDHEEQRWKAGDGESYVATDLVDVLLQRVEEDSDQSAESGEASRLTRDGVKAFIQDIIAGGTESSAVTMEWAMTELLRNPDAMAKATDELDRVVGRERWVTERDLPDLPYLDAVVKETLRLHPVGPLLVPHHAREDVALGGYIVPAGSRVLVNVWAVARDPASWPDEPEAFRPERFLLGGGAYVDVRGAHFELLPFGAGRRICPALGLAVKVVAAGVASMVQGFKWRLPDGVAPEDVSMEEHFGLSTRRKVPLVAVAEARMPADLYMAAVV